MPKESKRKPVFGVPLAEVNGRGDQTCGHGIPDVCFDVRLSDLRALPCR